MPKSLVGAYSKEELQQIANKSSNFKDFLRNLGYISTNGNVYKTVQKKVEEYNIDISHFEQHSSVKRSVENIFITDSTATQKVLREWYVKGEYSEYKCSICNLPAEWQGKPLVLTLDHINGISNDNRLENLRWVCPNCDRQLPTYSRGVRGLKLDNQ